MCLSVRLARLRAAGSTYDSGVARLVAFCLAALALGAPAAAAPSLQVTLLAPTHTPRAAAPWPYAVIVTDAQGKLIPARIHLQIMLGSMAVGQVGRHSVDGFWAETLEWPKDAVGQALTFEVEVSASGVVKKLDYDVTTKAGQPVVSRTLTVTATGPKLAAAVGNLRAPRQASLVVATKGRFDARWSVTCNKSKGSGVLVAAGHASGSGHLARSLMIPQPAKQDCAVAAVATAAGRVTVTLKGR